jgi:hypothetical protein
MDVELVRRICRDDPEAMDWLGNHWAPYCHAIDDVIDEIVLKRRAEDSPPYLAQAEFVIGVFAAAVALYSHPFYLRHIGALKAVVLNVTAMYAQTVQWESTGGNGGACARPPGGNGDWRETWADMHRHCSLEVVTAVAVICGGYAHARAVIPECRVTAYAEHHDGKGTPR